MTIGPKQMEEAMYQNMKKKTGKTVLEWVAILKSSKIIVKKEAVTFLKTEHGLGHFQSKLVFDHLNDIHEYKNEEDLISSLFTKIKTKNAYLKLAEYITSLGQDIKIQPCKTYIPFYRKKQFAILAPKGDDGLILGISYPDSQPIIDRLMPCKLGSSRINYQFEISSDVRLTQDIKQALITAYQNN